MRAVLRVSGDGFPDMVVGELGFSWMVEGAGGSQAAYRLKVWERGEDAPWWDSGWVEGEASCGVPYGGAALAGDRDYLASVNVRARAGQESGFSDPTPFSTGLLQAGAWRGAWLASPFALGEAGNPVFRKTVRVDKEVKRARLFVCGLGYYEVYLNGEKVGDRCLDPAWTDYEKRVNYVAYDVTGRLCRGENALGVLLGAGWYNSGRMNAPRSIFTMQISLLYEDGEREILPARVGDGWMALRNRPIRSASLYIGETVDARLWPENWCRADCRPGGEWAPALEAEPPSGVLTPMRVEPIRVTREIAAQTVRRIGPDAFVVDFGQNIAGVARLCLHGALPGQKIAIRYAEILDGEGMLNTLNLRGAQARDEYLCRGGEEVFQPRFTYHGFRYAEVRGLDELAARDIRALCLHSDLARRSTFACADSLVNAIQEICVRTEENNLHSVPTDCPQRDERLGWLNDLTVRLEELIYNFEADTFLEKYFVDMLDAQGPVTGAIPDTVPYVRYGGQPADAVCSSFLLLPWLVYQHYGDRALLARAFPALRAWTDYLARQREDGLVRYSYYGDWAAPIGGSIPGSVGSGAVSGITPGPLMSSGFLYMNCNLLEKMARILGMEEWALHYAALARQTRDALNRAYLDADKGCYATGSQAANAFMLYLGVAPREVRDKVARSLARDVLAQDTHLTTGNLCTRYLLDALADNGYIDLAYALVTQTTYPSWGYMLHKGATTVWERWEYVDSGAMIGMSSHDHPMYGAVSGWFYSCLAGIREPEAGFAHFELKPYFPQKLPSVRARVRTVKGEVCVDWVRENGRILLDVTLPFGCSCSFLPTRPCLLVDGEAARDAVVLRSGRHHLEIEA